MTGLETLVLARLASFANGASAATLRKALARAAGTRLSPAEWRRSLEQALQSAQAAGNVALQGRSRFQLTPHGREALSQALGVRLQSGAQSWRSLASALAARGMGLPVERARSAEAMKVALAARAQGLRVSPGATEARLRDLLTWKALGLELDRPVTKSALQAQLLRSSLGLGRTVANDEIVGLLAASAVGAKSASARALRAAGLARLIFAAEPSAEAAEGFAERVLRAARSVPVTERFGDEQVFICDAWRELRASDLAADLAGFKTLLWDAHCTGSLQLARADLVSAMDPEKVATSELRVNASTFHFIRV